MAASWYGSSTLLSLENSVSEVLDKHRNLETALTLFGLLTSSPDSTASVDAALETVWMQGCVSVDAERFHVR